ncbi:MAG TPA: hypothetical protein PKE26_02385 [Kiritimatiellia bacterium]|nr:hypothetical protein [Kiritimatiellia bacterium]HMO97936.1 hypothetical protein [Kiritimatiellia bacterium]HMP95287.1 hypothetical protein [Kiritimatiellia bacterium]
MNTFEPPSDEQLVNDTRRALSRRMDIPPTPRDTLAVLRQAAEQRRQTTAATGWWRAIALRPLWVAACVLFIGLAGWWSWLEPSRDATSVMTPEAIDPGFDLADWTLEFAALHDEIEQSILLGEEIDWLETWN